MASIFTSNDATMIANKEGIEFPGLIELNFDKLVQELEIEANSSSGARKRYLQELVQRVKAKPELTVGISSDKVEMYREIIDDLMAYVFPPVLTQNEIKIASAPWEFTPFYTSDRLRKIVAKNADEFNWVFRGFGPDQLYISACSAILGMHYGYKVVGDRPYFMELTDPQSGTTKHYRMAFNVDFISIKPTDRAKSITKEDYHQLIDNYHDIALWKEKFPPNSWIFSGFNLINMLDLSMDWNIKQIEEDLLKGGPDTIKSVQHHIAELLDVPDLEVSFVSLEGEGLLKMLGESQQSTLLGHEKSMTCEELFCSNTLKNIIENHEPLGIPNIDRFEKKSKSRLAKNIRAKGFKSFFVAPVLRKNKCIGLLELGSKRKGALNTTTFILLKEILPELAAAGHRFKQEHRNRIEAIIQEEFTSIHPSVKWRFTEEAEKLIKAEESNVQYSFKDPMFEGVYPLHGQLDIRGSSNLRNKAVRKDILTQLNSVESILTTVAHELGTPALEATMNDINEIKLELKEKHSQISENKILRFLEREIEPILLDAQHKHPFLKPQVAKYLHAVNNEFRILYAEHKKFDESVNSLNRFLSAYIDEKQKKAQNIYPHYFERHRTDGIEFNMYAGKSITRQLDFSQQVLRNLRLWQLIVMIEMERIYSIYKESLEMPLDIASHILAYNEPLAIHFRMDEKRFDIAGSYNARYELIKKRIDKAHIKGTKERITQPGKLVIIYSTQEVEDEYLAYLQTFQYSGRLSAEDPEILEVEDLQGVHGLKALRIGIQYPTSQEKRKSIDLDRFSLKLLRERSPLYKLSV